jgi:hypothetical protein
MVERLMWTRSPERLLIGLVLVAACSGCGGMEKPKPSGLPLKDDFSDCSSGWSTDTDEFVSLNCTGGAYRILIKNPQPQNARIFFSEGAPSLSVETDTTRRAGPRTVGIDRFLVYGVGCWRSQAEGYVFLISPDGAWGMEKATKGSSRPTTLTESETPNAIPGLATTNRIRGVCVGGGQEPTTLALYVNGNRIGSAEDRNGFDSFPGFGFVVLSSQGGTDVRFDNLVAREPTEAEARSVATGTTPEPHESKLCKRAGIRYAGTTAQGAEVCFTLTRDGSALVESGFSFVEASRCPDGATGTDHNFYPGRVDASGRVRNSHGFTATIRGASASGVFEDPEICPGKKFAWSARRQP